MSPALALGQVFSKMASLLVLKARSRCQLSNITQTTKQELLAKVHALKVWHCYLEGREESTGFTDHRANTFLDGQPTLSRCQTRWVDFLLRFQMEWTFKKEAENPAVPLSRELSFKACATLVGNFSKSEFLLC